MMFTCAHPALDRPSQLALTLRLVSGLTVPEIARALLVRPRPPSASESPGPRTRFDTPTSRCGYRPGAARRAGAARAVVHLLGVHRGVLVDRGTVGDPRRTVRRRRSAVRRGVRADARRAGRARAGSPVLLHDSRRATRVDDDGALVPLDEQDRRRWDRGKIARGLDRLRRAEGSTVPICRRR